MSYEMGVNALSYAIDLQRGNIQPKNIDTLIEDAEKIYKWLETKRPKQKQRRASGQKPELLVEDFMDAMK